MSVILLHFIFVTILSYKCLQHEATKNYWRGLLGVQPDHENFEIYRVVGLSTYGLKSSPQCRHIRLKLKLEFWVYATMLTRVSGRRHTVTVIARLHLVSSTTAEWQILQCLNVCIVVDLSNVVDNCREGEALKSNVVDLSKKKGGK